MRALVDRAKRRALPANSKWRLLHWNSSLRARIQNGMKADANDSTVNPTHTQHLPLESGGAARNLPAFQLKKILVPVDFSKCSAKALEYAVPFARQFGSELVLLHVIPPAVMLQTSEFATQGIYESMEAAKESLERMRQSVGDEISSRSLVRNGSPHVEIIDAAKELDIDLIILSTHGRTGLAHILLGATAERVVRRAGCPVLVVREHEHQFIHVCESAN
jgi:nucleotide-binding universal stress UspA family protein